MQMSISNFRLYKGAWINKIDLCCSRPLNALETQKLLLGGQLIRNIFNGIRQVRLPSGIL